MGFMDAIKTGTSYSSKIGAAGGGLIMGPSGAKRGWQEGDDWMGKKYRKDTQKDEYDKFKDYMDKREKKKSAESAKKAASTPSGASARSSYAIKDLLAYIQKMNIADKDKVALTQKVLETEKAQA